MKKYFKKLPLHTSSFIFSIIAIVIGLVLVAVPESSLKFICLVLGIITGVKGAFKLIGYINESRDTNGKTKDLVTASLTLALALILVIHPKPILSIFPSMVGIGILVYGIVTLLTKGKLLLINKIVGIAAIVIGIFVMNTPFILAEAATIIVGLSFIVIGIFTIVMEIRIKNNIDDLNLPYSDGYTEVDFKDVDE